MVKHAICSKQIEIFLIAEAIPASHQISWFKIQESILYRCQCVIDPDLSGGDSEIVEELFEIFIATEKAPQAVSQLDREGYREFQKDLARLQVLADFPDNVGYVRGSW